MAAVLIRVEGVLRGRGTGLVNDKRVNLRQVAFFEAGVDSLMDLRVTQDAVFERCHCWRHPF